MRRRGLSLVEILIVVAVIAIVAAISYPVINSVRAEGRVSHCIERLRQTGLAVAMYRENNNGSTAGFAWEMGLPTTYEGQRAIQQQVVMKCPEVNYAVRKYEDFGFFGGEPGAAATEEWPAWVVANGESTVMFGDINHNPDRNFLHPSFAHLGLALALDTSVRRIRKPGHLGDTSWWQRLPKEERR